MHPPDSIDPATAAKSPAFVAVDWGTSSLRAWVIDASGAVLAETRSAEGMSSVEPGSFEAVFRARIADLGDAVTRLPSPLPAVLCGMVGARQGWREAGYLDVPAPLSDLADRAVAVAADGIDARILPGLARRATDRPDVMRGEETQLLGVVLDDPGASGLVCMPGTHSKWVTLQGGRVEDFTTVPTGELFQVLSRETILRHTVGDAAATGDPSTAAFRAGLGDGLSDPGMLCARLFSIRAAHLLAGVDGEAAADRLSGLLIGAEVGAMFAAVPSAEPVRLVAGGRLARLYAAAIEAAGRAVALVDADHAVRAGLTHAARRLWPSSAGSPAR
ncbi:MAG TPA: 2-dehydro-3-deoxygalactonokinase [Methylomirabilota bacterium]|nr:2-dehydro-3-deoxygalactonokinase [Methylomirabilota bacterium]